MHEIYNKTVDDSVRRKEGISMKVIFEEYSGIIVTAVAIVALIAIVGFLLAAEGPVHTAFAKMISELFAKTGMS